MVDAEDSHARLILRLTKELPDFRRIKTERENVWVNLGSYKWWSKFYVSHEGKFLILALSIYFKFLKAPPSVTPPVFAYH